MKLIRNFKYIPFIAMEVDADVLAELITNPDVSGIEEDRLLAPALQQSGPLVGANESWAAGYSGAGQTIAILDTGVDRNHPFLNGKVVSEACYSDNLCPGGTQSQVGTGAGINCPLNIGGCNHGTHVAGIAAGSGPAFSGVARDASLISIQVFSRFDSVADCNPHPVPCALARNSSIAAGLERVYELRQSFNIAAVNMSLGSGRYTSPCDSSSYVIQIMQAIIVNLRTERIPTIISSGNDSFTDAIAFPACLSSAISVGATTKADIVASYSNSASFLSLLAPGSSINSSVPGTGFSLFSGTSMAAPHVAGAWAIYKSKTPTATVDEVLSALTNTGLAITDARNGITKRRIQVDEAVDADAKSVRWLPAIFNLLLK